MSPIVLIVDDSPENRHAAQRHLSRAGFEVWEAETGAEGLQLALADPDLILLDVHLPDIDGIEVCRRLKQDPATTWIPVLQRSQTEVDDAARVLGLESGADAYLTEPIAGPVLVATARALLRMREAESRLRVQIAHAEMVNRLGDTFAPLLTVEQVVAAANDLARHELGAAVARVDFGPGQDHRALDESTVPLVAYGHALGRLHLRFDAQAADPARIAALAEQTARALERAALYERQQNIATTLQAGLLPPRLPNIPGYEIAAEYLAGTESMEVGGDFYDAFARDADWVLVIGDVCGRGAEAAALTSLARHTIRAQAQHHHSPSDILWALHQAVLAESRGRPRFLTAELLVLSGDQIHIARAGHPPGLLLRVDGNVEELPTGGTVLGMTVSQPCPQTSGRLDPGDALILYTDGVTESRHGAEQFGETRLRALLAGLAGAGADRIAEAVRSAAVEFAETAEDDLAVLVLRRLP